MNAAHRTPAAEPTQIDHVRGFPNSYEVDAFGYTCGTSPLNAWQRGTFLRGPGFVAAGYERPPLPMYDPTMPTAAAKAGR